VDEVKSPNIDQQLQSPQQLVVFVYPGNFDGEEEEEELRIT